MLLRPKISLSFLLVAVLPVFIIGALTYSYVKAAMEQSVLDGIHIISELNEANLFLHLQQTKQTTKHFSSDGFIRDSIEKLSLKSINKNKISASLNKHLLNNKKPLTNGVLYIDVINTKGIVSSSSDPDRVGIDFNQDNIKKHHFLNYNKVHINNIHRDKHGNLEIGVSAPLFSRTNSKKQVGVLINHFSFNSIKNLFNGKFVLEMGAKSQLRGLGKTGETYLVNKNKIMISDSRFIKKAVNRQVVDTYPVNMNIKQGKEVLGIWKDYRGVEVIGSSISINIDNLKLTLITEQNIEEAFSSIEKIKNIYLLIMAIISMLVLFTAIYISRMITRPIGLLADKLEALGNGEHHVQTTEIKSNDEIGSLSKSFDKMSLKLNNANKDIQKKNKQLEDLSNRDGLTGLYNHRYLSTTLESEFDRSSRYNLPLSCILLDIDFFKSINDTYGHLFGDVVLKGVATIIKDYSRKSDIASRYGGEEFVILLPNTELDQAQILAVKLFEAISSAEYADDTNKVSIKVSIGLSSFHDQLEKYTDLLAEADKAMYEAKNSGRNKICVFRRDEVG